MAISEQIPLTAIFYFGQVFVFCKLINVLEWFLLTCVKTLGETRSRKLVETVLHRPSQIACTVTIVHVTCTQKAFHVHENSCTVLIPLCKNNLNLPIHHTDNCTLWKYEQPLQQLF